jgi:hypothetical protein
MVETLTHPASTVTMAIEAIKYRMEFPAFYLFGDYCADNTATAKVPNKMKTAMRQRWYA